MIHHLLQMLYSHEASQFEKSLPRPEETQRAVLKRILKETAKSPYGKENLILENDSYEIFILKNPVTTYEAWEAPIEKQRQTSHPILSGDVVRYEPTSGSLSQRKWIPYPRLFLKEINRAAQTWMHDLYSTHPGVKKGTHFWSLSWIPNELRGSLQTDDSQLFPAYQRFFLNRFLSRHPAIQYAPSAASAWWATKLHLASLEDLSFLSIWSPSYLLSALEELFEERASIAKAFLSQTWVKHEAELSRYPTPRRNLKSVPAIENAGSPQELAKILWPHLDRVSCWDSASSHELAMALREMLPFTKLQSKGLWATEGVVTFPWRDAHPLAIRSHFYEFRILGTEEIIPVWKLKKGMEVQPILTTGTGMLRYALPDRTLVSGFIEKTPTLEFLGRIGSVDLVGEKLSFSDADQILSELRSEFPRVHFYCLAASLSLNQQKALYQVLAVPENELQAANPISEAFEKKLLKYHHYSVARELRQMEIAECVFFREIGPLVSYVERSQVRGQNKLNSIMRMGKA